MKTLKFFEKRLQIPLNVFFANFPKQKCFWQCSYFVKLSKMKQKNHSSWRFCQNVLRLHCAIKKGNIHNIQILWVKDKKKVTSIAEIIFIVCIDPRNVEILNIYSLSNKFSFMGHNFRRDRISKTNNYKLQNSKYSEITLS